MTMRIHPSTDEIITKQPEIKADKDCIIAIHPSGMVSKKKRQAFHRTPSACITKQRKQSIPASVKSALWVSYNGKNFEAKCHVKWCKTMINVFNFEAGHDVPESKGGATTLENLRPICALCNKSMSNNYTIEEFSRKYSLQKEPFWHRLVTKLHLPLFWRKH